MTVLCSTSPNSSGTVGYTAKFVARNVTPTNRTVRTPAITSSVVAALRASGGLNAGTPVAIASVPVSATAPEANARRSRKTDTAPAVLAVASTTSGGGGWTSPRTMIRYDPMAIIANALNMNR